MSFTPSPPDGRPLGLGELLFNASGRLGRGLFLAATAGLTAILWLYDRMLGFVGHLMLGWIVHPVLFTAGACIVAKRLHDRGRSGWWAAVVLAGFCLAWPWPRGPIGVLGLVILLITGLPLALAPGEPRFNRFGPPPRRP